MQILSWNIRAGGGKRAEEIVEQIIEWDPTIIALGEFRGTPPSMFLRHKLADLGWYHQANTTHQTAKLATNALLTASRFPLKVIKHPLAPKEPGRWLMVEITVPEFQNPITLINVHVPNRASGRKYSFYESVLQVLRAQNESKPLIPGLMIGDTNSGLPFLDGTDTFTQEEIGWMHALEKTHWHDALRHLNGNKKVFTWYSPNAGNGFRFDQAFVNPPLLPSLHSIEHPWGVSQKNPSRRDALSDHAAVLVKFKGKGDAHTSDSKRS